MAIPTIEQLEAELLTRVKAVPAIGEYAFSVFSIEDLETKAELQRFPIAGVGYNGAFPVANVNQAKPTSDFHAANLIELQFVVMVGIQYAFAGQENTKPQATNLLGQLRSAILGFKGVNSRPWRFIGERPEPEANADGVVFYSQVWHTAVPVVGTFNNL